MKMMQQHKKFKIEYKRSVHNKNKLHAYKGHKIQTNKRTKKGENTHTKIHEICEINQTYLNKYYLIKKNANCKNLQKQKDLNICITLIQKKIQNEDCLRKQKKKKLIENYFSFVVVQLIISKCTNVIYVNICIYEAIMYKYIYNYIYGVKCNNTNK